MIELLDRRALKARAAALLARAQVSPKGMTALYMGLGGILGLLVYVSGNGLNISAVFLSVLVSLLSLVLDAGFALYCMAIRRGERAEYLTLFDGFALAGKLILLTLAQGLFVFLWSMLFVIPGLIAMYRYRFAIYNLLENPKLGVMETISMSKRQTVGYKSQLFMLDLSYLGWVILSSIPERIYSQVLSGRAEYAIQSAGNLDEFLDLYNNAVSVPVFGMSGLTWQILIALWALAVGLFYVANRQCVELDYFDAAKRSSGVGELPYDTGDFWDGGPSDGNSTSADSFGGDSFGGNGW